ncbi:hypothetical protein LZ554_005087 [Drepanopeziza brunnea f. sp. 'monogermtubi']|nr:hypothetical protein LZ554_005087 [Drepanopeziza brunnea f. sp. 'monogermtubi']
MGNNSTKETRGLDSSSTPNLRRTDSGGAGPASSGERPAPVYSSRAHRERGTRPDLSFLGIGTSAQQDIQERRETKQEREARKLEKERVARVKQRERSLKEEHIDGGFLVTMGVYTGPEDFNKAIVRQLMIERRMAPFWRGLDDFKEEWTEHQLVAAGRGLPIPAADEIPPEDLPISSRSQAAASDASAMLSPLPLALSNPSTPSAAFSSSAPTTSSPFRPRSKTLASLTNASKNISSSEISPREVQLQHDPYVNGQAIEVYLYKDSTECPICFMYYPPYLNKTRCCDQPICSECFVQIKRPDPHPPEHHDPSNPTPPPTELNVDPEALVSEPACCPYCQQPEFGVTYEPPPFRRGLSYANAHNVALSTSSRSINPAGASTGILPAAHKRRTISISANASTVITTDKVRPDWCIKLQNARSHLARRAAQATAMHTAAYQPGSGNAPEQRGFVFSGRPRFGRSRNESSPGASGAATPPPTANEPAARSMSDQHQLSRREAQESGGARHRSRMEELEDMMMMEAIRQSLAAEEERKKKLEKEAAKEAKKKAKEDKKKEKRESRRVYGSGTSSASASALSLSLPSLSIGRRRTNSGAGNLQRDAMLGSPESPETKGKGIDRGDRTGGSAPVDLPRAGSSSGHGIPGARHIDTTTLSAIDSRRSSASPTTSPTAPEKPSHLRQMSNASSPASSIVEWAPVSLRNDPHTHGSSSTLDSPNPSGSNFAAGSSDGGDVGTESLSNFHSLATMVSADSKEDKQDATKHIEHLCEDGSKQNTPDEQPDTTTIEESVATSKADDSIAAKNGATNQT